MSSIRLFILGSLADRGPMHGHQIRLLAEQEHIHLWTDFTVGGIYGAIKRLAAEDLIEDVRTEREGNYPERQVYGITAAGREALSAISSRALRDIAFRPDPFDLAITRLDRDQLDALPGILETRRQALVTMLVTQQEHLGYAGEYLTIAETMTMHHQQTRLTAEIDWLDSLIAKLPEIVAQEKSRKES